MEPNDSKSIADSLQSIFSHKESAMNAVLKELRTAIIIRSAGKDRGKDLKIDPFVEDLLDDLIERLCDYWLGK